MLGLINWRLKITINDGRAFIGQMLAFDRHMNLVLADCEEFRRVRLKKKPGETEAGPEQEMKRSLGLVILRGETVVSLSVEGPPPVQDDDKKSAVCAALPICRNPQNLSLFPFLMHLQLPAGPGRGMPAGRGMGMVPPGACCCPAPRNFQSGTIVTYGVTNDLRTDSWTPGLCETTNAVCATWHARRTPRLPSPRISARCAFPSPSWVRWTPSSRVRQWSGM